MSYKFIAEIFHIGKLFSTISLRKVNFYGKRLFAFLSTSLGAYGQCTLFILGSLESPGSGNFFGTRVPGTRLTSLAFYMV